MRVRDVGCKTPLVKNKNWFWKPVFFIHTPSQVGEGFPFLVCLLCVGFFSASTQTDIEDEVITSLLWQMGRTSQTNGINPLNLFFFCFIRTYRRARRRSCTTRRAWRDCCDSAPSCCKRAPRCRPRSPRSTSSRWPAMTLQMESRAWKLWSTPKKKMSKPLTSKADVRKKNCLRFPSFFPSDMRTSS